MKLLLICALDEDHVYSYSARALRRAFNDHGEEAQIFDYFKHPEDLAAELVEGRYDAVISFSSFLGDLKVKEGMSIFEVVGTKFVGWHFDHPIYVSPHICNPTAGRRIIHAHRNHARFVEAAGISAVQTVLLPGAQPHPCPIKDHADRDMDVFVAATWNGEPMRSWETLEDSPAKHIIIQVTERLLADREVSVIDAFHAACGALGYAGLKLDENVFGLLRPALTYVRHLDRLNTVRKLAEAGLSLTICGSGWEQVLAGRSNVRLLPSRSFEQTQSLYGDAKVSINLNGGNGGCERAINAMLAGSCVVSDYSRTLAEAFSPQEVRFFERDGLHGVAEVVADLLEGAQAETIGARALARASGTMLWTHRVDPVLALLG